MWAELVMYCTMWVMMEGKRLWWADCERDGGAHKWGTFHTSKVSKCMVSDAPAPCHDTEPMANSKHRDVANTRFVTVAAVLRATKRR